MEHIEVQKRGPRTPVPQFGGWDQKDGAVTSGYTVMFTKARADRQHKKNDLSEVKRQTQLKDHHQDNIIPGKHKSPPPHHHHHNKKHNDRYGKPEEEQASASAAAIPMGRKRNNIMSWFFGCSRP